MWDEYRRFLTKPPLEVVTWQDEPTGAYGWLVINSLRGGAAGGGTRMRVGVTLEEVTYLAKTMELKFAYSGPPVGGAKSGIAFDHRDPRKREVLERWFSAMHPHLSTCYGTAGDVGVDEQRDIVPICRTLGLKHHQHGIVTGHFKAEGAELDAVIASIDRGLTTPVPDMPPGPMGSELMVSDVVTGYGVAAAAASVADARGRALEDQRVILEGFGNVGGSAALYFTRRGARVVAITDAGSAVVNEAGFSMAEVEDLFTRRDNGLLPESPWTVTGTARAGAYRVPADVFVPAAISGSIDARRLDDLATAGVHTIVCGANQPVAESRLGDTTNLETADQRFDIVPDAIASQGMARAFNFFMRQAREPSSTSVSDRVAESIDGAVREAVARRGPRPGGLVEAALGVALERVSADEGTAVGA
jgi:glutamate dehydrogenase/leucine dehydrogenase